LGGVVEGVEGLGWVRFRVIREEIRKAEERGGEDD
jgi:hypothetical protein